MSPEAVAACLLQQYDKDQSGELSADECVACPALAASLSRYDANRDGSLSGDEIQTRLAAMLASRVGRMPCQITVYLGGRLLAGASVELIPEECLRDAVSPAAAATNDKGVAKPVTVGAPPGLPGAQFGLYRIAITHPELPLPSRYNSETELGMELSPLERESDKAEFHLKTK
jgi:hypothetical protein